MVYTQKQYILCSVPTVKIQDPILRLCINTMSTTPELSKFTMPRAV
jgi:hypothetical protein